MKQILLSAMLILTAISLSGQTASNFTANDCQGNNHDLFTELDAGKIVVITWVMPCSSCINGATAAQNAVNSFSLSHPGQVVHYCADDYANTSCTSLNNWCATNSISPHASFSSASVNMNGYGAAGMPKVVVLGASTHSVFYNVNNANISQTGIQNAITSALNTVATSIRENSFAEGLAVSPNPVSGDARISFRSKAEDLVRIEVLNVLGQKVIQASHRVNAGHNELKLETSSLPNGNYFVRLSNGKNTQTLKFILNQ